MLTCVLPMDESGAEGPAFAPLDGVPPAMRAERTCGIVAIIESATSNCECEMSTLTEWAIVDALGLVARGTPLCCTDENAQKPIELQRSDAPSVEVWPSPAMFAWNEASEAVASEEATALSIIGGREVSVRLTGCFD